MPLGMAKEFCGQPPGGRTPPRRAPPRRSAGQVARSYLGDLRGRLKQRDKGRPEPKTMRAILLKRNARSAPVIYVQ